MKHSRLLSTAFALLLVLAMALPAMAGGRPLSADLLGTNEVSNGDLDGSGSIHMTLNQGQGQICFDLAFANIAGPSAAHIHSAPAGVNGPVVVPLFTSAPAVTHGCVSADKHLIKEIRKSPQNYYVNVHNSAHPTGAIRGQLSK